MCHVAGRQRRCVDNAVAGQVCYRYLGRGNQVERRIIRRLELVVLEFGQLAGAEQRVCLNQVGHVGLYVTVLRSVHVQHELDQGTLQPRQPAGHYGKAGTGYLRRRIEVQHVECGAEIDMVSGFEIERGRLTPLSNLDIGRFIGTNGHVIGKQVGEAELGLPKLCLN